MDRVREDYKKISGDGMRRRVDLRRGRREAVRRTWSKRKREKIESGLLECSEG